MVMEAFFKLIKLGLWGKGSNEGSRDIQLSDEQWKELFDLTTNHTLDGIIYTGIQLLDVHFHPDSKLLFSLASRVDQIERRNIRMNKFIALQSSWFEKNKLQPILLKGQGIAQSYEHPLRRVCGDIDWYLSPADFTKSISLLKQKDISLKSLNPESLSYLSNNLVVEHHNQVFDLSNPFKKRVGRKLLEQWHADHIEMPLGGGFVKTLKPLGQIVQVNVHILKHLLAFGIGFRQLCDSARIYYDFYGSYDPDELKDIYRKMGILHWSHYLHDILVQHFGLERKYLPYPVPDGIDSRAMLDEIRESGNFGFYDKRYIGGKINPFSIREGSLTRVWKSLRLYFPICPGETIFFILKRIYQKPFNQVNPK